MGEFNLAVVKSVAGPIEATATGNAVVQLIALGEIKDLAEARRVIANNIDLKIYEPNNILEVEKAYIEYLKYQK